ncbi:MAG TPA: hypothetical protein VLT45_10630 [Kofleriaceae bacterium]|nr:hypothetical protein [Kofleriaceae bacterium]
MDEQQPADLNDVFRRPAAAPPPAGYPPIGAAIAQRARPVSAPPPFNGPSGDGFAQSIYESERQAARSRNITVGLILLVIGIAVTAFTYDSASSSPSGGTYIVAWGPMVFGAIRLFKGLAG